MMITWLCFHCQQAIALVEDGKVFPTAGCQVVWATEAVGITPLYCCLYCGALQMPPRYGVGVEKEPATKVERPLECERPAGDREDARRYRALKFMMGLNPSPMVIRQEQGSVSVMKMSGGKVSGINLDNALDKVKEAV